jgi:hypothetical protein
MTRRSYAQQWRSYSSAPLSVATAVNELGCKQKHVRCEIEIPVVYVPSTCLVDASTALSPKYCSSFKMLQGIIDKWWFGLKERKSWMRT